MLQKKKNPSPTQLFWLLQNPAKPELDCNLQTAIEHWQVLHCSQVAASALKVLSGKQVCLFFSRTPLSASSRLTACLYSSAQQPGYFQYLLPTKTSSDLHLATNHFKKLQTSEEGGKTKRSGKGQVSLVQGTNKQANNPPRSISLAGQNLLQPGHP